MFKKLVSILLVSLLVSSNLTVYAADIQNGSVQTQDEALVLPKRIENEIYSSIVQVYGEKQAKEIYDRVNSVEWVNPKNKNIKGRLTAGASVAHDIREEHTHAGYIVKAAGEYEKDLEKYQRGIFKPKRAAGRLELFQTSPDFYIASSDSTSKNDRTGGKVSGNVSFNSTNAINTDIYQGTKKEKAKNDFNKSLYFKIFGGVALATAGIY